MWLYCPNCSNQKDVGRQSRYNVFVCDHCNHSFRGIHAKPNTLWHKTAAFLWSYEDFESTPYPHCHQAVVYRGQWPSVCSKCTRTLPTDAATPPTPDVSQQSPSTKALPSQPPPAPAVSQQTGSIKPTPVKPSPPPKQAVDFDGCGPCTSCGFIFQMMFNNAVCPKCRTKMSREDAFFSCGSYPHSTPPESQ